MLYCIPTCTNKPTKFLYYFKANASKDIKVMKIKKKNLLISFKCSLNVYASPQANKSIPFVV